MMCQAIPTAVDDSMSDSTHNTSPPIVQEDGGMAAGVVDVELLSRFQSPAIITTVANQVSIFKNVLSRTRTGTPPPDVTEDTAPKLYHKKGTKSDVTMKYCSVCKLLDYHNDPGHDAWNSTQGSASGTGGYDADDVATVGGGEDLDDDLR